MNNILPLSTDVDGGKIQRMITDLHALGFDRVNLICNVLDTEAIVWRKGESKSSIHSMRATVESALYEVLCIARIMADDGNRIGAGAER